MVTTKLNLSMTEPQVRQIYAKQGDTGRVLDISLDQTPEDGTLRILRPDGTEVTSEAVTGGEVSESGETVTFESLTEADVTELTVGIEPVQDLNGYDKPWVGGAGKNKYDDSAKTNALINEQGAETTNTAWYLSDYCAIPSGTTKVTLSWQSDMTYYQGRVVAYDSSKAFISGSYVAWAGTAQSHTFDVPSTASYVRVNYSHVVNSQESPRNNVRLNVGASDLGYSPYSNICPITGHDEVTVTRTGKNLCTRTGVNNTVIGQAKKGMTYTFSVRNQGSCGYNIKKNNNSGATIATTDGEHPTDAVIPVTFTADEDCNLFLNGYGMDGYTFLGSAYDYQLELGSTATAYEPYQANTYTTSLGQTVYGGTLDMVTGVLTVDKAMVDMGSLTWRENGAITGGFQYATEIADKKRGEQNFVCSAFATSFPTVTLGYICGRAATRTVAANSPLTTLADFVASVTGQTIVYELETPQTYTLTAQQIKTLVGTNNVWASSGDIVNVTFTYGGLLSELPSEATEIVGKCYCDIEQNGVSSMPFTLNVKKNERQ